MNTVQNLSLIVVIIWASLLACAHFRNDAQIKANFWSKRGRAQMGFVASLDGNYWRSYTDILLEAMMNPNVRT